MPGRVDISTTPAGSTVSVSRFRVRSDGNLSIGGVGSSGVTLNIAKDSTGSATYTNLSIFNTVRKDVTGGLVSFSSFPGFEAAPFSLPYVYHYIAGQSALSSGPIIDLQSGFRAYSFLTGANTNWGFTSNIAAPVSGPAGPFTVNTVSCSGTTVTLNTTVAHSLVNGQTVSVSLLVNATALVTGVVCTITTVGTTDFTLIGAASNTVGLSFTATGAGTGTGTVTLNCQGGGITVGGSSGTTFTYTTTVSATFAAVTVATGTVIVSKRYNFYAEGTADNFFAGNTGFGVLSPTEKVDVIGRGLFRAAANQDGILLSGRAGGSGGFTATLTPATLTAIQTLTLPDTTGTIITTGDTGTVTSAMIAADTIVNADVSPSAAIAGTKISPNFGSQNITTTGTTGGKLRPPAGVATADGTPLELVSGTLLTTPEAGAFEYDGTYLYTTSDTTSARGHLPTWQTFRLTSNGSAVGPAIGDFYGATSAINLVATSVYDIEFFAYLQKNTAGTLTWTYTASSAPTLISGTYTGPPVTGIAGGAQISGYAGSRGVTTAAFAATASVTGSAFMAFYFKTQVVTNAATTFRLRVTNSVGTVTPQAGSYFTVRRISTTTGSYA
jgi:hypothetical protein